MSGRIDRTPHAMHCRCARCQQVTARWRRHRRLLAIGLLAIVLTFLAIGWAVNAAFGQ